VLAPGQIPAALPAEPGTGRSRPAQLVEHGRPFQFGISTLLLIMTLFAVLCSVWRMAPGLGAVLTVVTCIGLAGLAGRSVAAAREGTPLTAADKLVAFFRPLWIVTIVLVVIVVVIVGGLFAICAASLGNMR
jgi:hypothetical protein